MFFLEFTLLKIENPRNRKTRFYYSVRRLNLLATVLIKTKSYKKASNAALCVRLKIYLDTLLKPMSTVSSITISMPTAISDCGR